MRRFREEVVERAQEEGYVTTLMGRRRPIPELRSGNPNTRRLGERLAVNTVIQGTAADIIKVAMVRCWARLREERMETRLVLQIHDELLFEGPPEEMDAALELVRREMTARLPARSAARGRRRRRHRLAERQVAPTPAASGDGTGRSLPRSGSRARPPRRRPCRLRGAARPRRRRRRGPARRSSRTGASPTGRFAAVVVTGLGRRGRRCRRRARPARRCRHRSAVAAVVVAGRGRGAVAAVVDALALDLGARR